MSGEGELVAVLDAGEAGGPGIHIGSLTLDGVELGEVKIPAGLHAVLQRSQIRQPRLRLRNDVAIGNVSADVSPSPENK